MLYGPNTNLGHNSILAMLECQFGYVLQGLALIEEKQAAIDAANGVVTPETPAVDEETR